jgi:hypothetical protein
MKIHFAIILTATLTACATQYQAEGFRGGYTDTQLDTNVFRITFKGNLYSSFTRTEELTLLRGAELTLKNGFYYFTVLDNVAEINQDPYIAPTTQYVQSFPTSSKTVMCFKDKPIKENLVYNAQIICKSLGEKYQASCNVN